jgi:hypothetical protein
MKSFSVGSEVSAKPPFNQRPCEKGLTKNLPPHLQEAIKPVSKRGNTISNIHRFWIQAGELVYEQKQVGSKLTFHLGNIKMSVRSHPLVPGPDGKLEDTEEQTDPDSPEAKFAADLTAHYDEIGLHFPMFARLRELAKLQMLSPVLNSVLEDMRSKANGVGVEVPRRLLTEIQQEARERHRTQVQEMIRNLNQEVGVWPAAEDYSEIYSLAQKMINELPYHVRSQASYSDVEPYAKQALRTKDSSVLSQVVDGLMQLCGHSLLSRSYLESSVSHWLSTRSSSAAENLQDLVCSALPVPTNTDIKQQMVEAHSQRYHAFKQKVDSVTSPRPRLTRNPCQWVPAALLKEETGDSLLMCYGGVSLLVDFRSGRVRGSSRAKSIPVQRYSALEGQYRSSTSYRAPPNRASASNGNSGTRKPITVTVNRSSSASNSSTPKAANRPANMFSSALRFNSSATNNASRAQPSSLNSAALASKAVGKGVSTSKARSTITNNSRRGNRNDRRRNCGGTGGNGGNGGGSSGGSGDEGGRKGRLSEEEFLRRKDEKTKEVKEQATKSYSDGRKGETRKHYYFYNHPKYGEIVVSPIRHGSHAQAAFKEYAPTKSQLIFIGSLDVNLERMKGKHESNEGKTIKIKDLTRER